MGRAPAQEARPTYPGQGHQSAENSRGHCPGARQPGAKGNRPSPTPSGRPASRRGHHRVPRGTHRIQRPATRREAGIPGESQSLLLPPVAPRTGLPGACTQAGPAAAASLSRHSPGPDSTRSAPFHPCSAAELHNCLPTAGSTRPTARRWGKTAAAPSTRGRSWVCAAVSRSPPPRAPGRAGAWSRCQGHLCARRGPPFPACSPTLAHSSTSAGLARSDTGDPAPPGPSAGREDLTVGSKEGETSQGRVALPAVPGLPGDVP